MIKVTKTENHLTICLDLYITMLPRFFYEGLYYAVLFDQTFSSLVAQC